MPIRCYYKPNRLTKRKFTEKDAARVLCSALDSSSDLSDSARIFFDGILKCQPEFFDKYIFIPLVCPKIKVLISDAQVLILNLNPYLRLASDFVDAFDRNFTVIESLAERFGLSSFNAISAVLDNTRGLLDSLEQTVENASNAVDTFLIELSDLGEKCNGS
jgi:hypothetical protein